MKKASKATTENLEKRQSAVLEDLVKIAKDRSAKKFLLWNDADAVQKIITSAQSEKTTAGIIFETFRSQKICSYVPIFSNLLLLYETQLKAIRDKGEVRDSAASFLELMFAFEKAILADVEVFNAADRAYGYVDKTAQELLNGRANQGKEFRELLRQQYDGLYAYQYLVQYQD